MKKIAIFDVCDTLYNVNTTFSFLDDYFLENRKYLFFRKVSKLFPVKVANYFIYKFFKKDLIRIYGTTFLKNCSYKEIQEHSHKFVNENLTFEIKDAISLMIKEYKIQGYKIVLMSGSYEFIIKEVSYYFDADYFYASKLEIKNGCYTGKYEKDILLSKYELLQSEFTVIDELIVVSDNKTDLVLMQSADKAYAVCNKEKDCDYWKEYEDIICIRDF